MHYSLHDCRHTCACRLLFLAEGLTPPDGSIYSPTEWTNLRKAAFTAATDSPDRAWHLSSVFNHGSPETTFEHYVHCSDLVLRYHLAKSERRLPRRTLRALLDNPKLRLRTEAPRNREGHLLEGILPAVYECSKPQFELVETRTTTPTPASPTAPPESSSEIRRVPFEVAQRILEELERGEAPEACAILFDVELDTVRTLARRAAWVADQRTRFGPPRAMGRARLREAGHPLAPSPLREAEDQELVRALMHELREVMRTDRQLLRDACTHWVRHTNTSVSGLPFHHPRDLDRFLSCFADSKAVPAERWLVLVRPPKGQDDVDALKAWRVRPKIGVDLAQHKRSDQTRTTRFTSNVTRYPFGVAYLHLQKKGEVKQGWRKNTSKALRYLLHMLCIYLPLPATSQSEDDSDKPEVPPTAD